MRAVEDQTGLASEEQCFEVSVLPESNHYPPTTPPTFSLGSNKSTFTIGSRSRTHLEWVAEAYDGDGGVQRPGGGGTSNTVIRFETTSNSHPKIFLEQPW